MYAAAMPTWTLRSLFAVVLFVFTAQNASAAAPPKKPAEAATPAAGKAKAGEACKSNADCDQSSAPLSCQKAKCELDQSKMPPPAT